MISAKRFVSSVVIGMLLLLAVGYLVVQGAQAVGHSVKANLVPQHDLRRGVSIATHGGQDTSLPAATQDKIVFVRPQPETGADANIWIMDADGSNQSQLTTFSGDDRLPALSPDGSQIAYLSLQNSQWTLWAMSADGTNAVQLPFSGNAGIPIWSPDGSKIALQGDGGDGTWWEVWVINANASNPTRLTNHAEAAGSPSWSPDGQKIVYLSEPIARYHNLYIINNDGTGQTLLSSASSTGFSHHRPAWSPDGTQIATLRYAAGGFGPYDLWVMNNDGSNGITLVQGIDSPNLNRISWSPDSNWIAFGKNGQIWKVQRDGTQLTQITTTEGWEPSIGPGFASCTPQSQESDIMLVVDRSGSMANDNKLDDARIAVTTFLSSTHTPPDQVGLVSFASTATLDQPLTTDKAAVISATQALTAAGGTRIDYALLEARLELTSTRHMITHTKVIILLTDGQQNPAGNDPVIAEANAAKAEGATLFTIGLGPDVDTALLQQVATSPGHYYFAPTGADLEGIYQQIAGAIACPDIGGRVYVDQDSNGQYTPGMDPPLSNVTIKMSGQATWQTTSQADGSYLFANNFPGTYTVTLDLTSVPFIYQPITPTVYAINLSAQDDLDNHFGVHPKSIQSKIAFTRPQPGTGADTNIWTMDVDGSDQAQLTTYNGEDQWPALAPDGSKIAYVSWRENRWTLWIMNSDGTNQHQLPVVGSSIAPTWSPDGSQIAFGNDAVDWWEIWIINADGTNLRRVTTHGPAAGHPAWSPNGQKIVYGVEPYGQYFDLYTVISDGTGQTLLVPYSSGYSNHIAAWSPDGTQIATVHWPAGSFGPRDLWVMNSNGSGGNVVAHDVEYDTQNLSWSADSDWLVFSKNGQIWRVRRDGSQLTQITLNGGWEPSTSASGFGPDSPIKRVYLPALTRNYCAGPIVDDFSNPASGWPIADTNYWTYGYVNGEYRMYAKASVFGAVSRGEQPIGQYTVEVDVRRANTIEGSVGIVFGLNSDWSDLYTFEVYPSAQLWAIFQFSGGQWSVVTYGASDVIQSGQSTNRLRIQTVTDGTHVAHFYVNDFWMTAMYLPYSSTTARRVGLTATSDAAGFDARFDNYKLVAEGCPETFQSSQQGGEAPAPTFESLRPVEVEADQR